MRRLRLAAVLLAVLAPSIAHAWNDHITPAYLALEAMPEVAGAAPVRVESLQTFLEAEQKGIAALLRDEEAWARQHIAHYPPRPDGLEFKEAGGRADVRERFLRALRLNPTVHTSLFIVPRSGDAGGRPTLPETQVTVFETYRFEIPFVALKEGETVGVLEVVATASDEPDYGHDIKLYEDNGAAWGKEYGLGVQPFGNPKLEFSSQAPFHMGFYYEAGIVYKFAPFLRYTWPELRARQALALARYAFRTGHPYWGWRFTGWGLHYLQDLTQPYHATVFPGVGTGRVLWRNALTFIGIDGPQDRAVQLSSNRHVAIEKYQKDLVRKLVVQRTPNHPVSDALADPARDRRYPAYTDTSARGVIAKESYAAAASTDALIEETFPEKYVDDPDYELGDDVEQIDMLDALKSQPAEKRAQLDAALAGLLGSFGTHSRLYVRAALAP